MYIYIELAHTPTRFMKCFCIIFLHDCRNFDFHINVNKFIHKCVTVGPKELRTCIMYILSTHIG